MRLDSQLSRMYCQMFSTGLSFWRFWRQRHQGDVIGDGELVREMPAGLVEQQHGLGTGFDCPGDFRQVEGHRGGIAARQHQACRGAAGWADRAKQIGRAGALVVRCRRPGAASRPAPSNLVLLANAGLVLEPDLYWLARCRASGDLVQAGEEVFLNAATASPSWA
jgi:hypothetical protein